MRRRRRVSSPSSSGSHPSISYPSSQSTPPTLITSCSSYPSVVHHNPHRPPRNESPIVMHALSTPCAFGAGTWQHGNIHDHTPCIPIVDPHHTTPIHHSASLSSPITSIAMPILDIHGTHGYHPSSWNPTIMCRLNGGMDFFSPPHRECVHLPIKITLPSPPPSRFMVMWSRVVSVGRV